MHHDPPNRRFLALVAAVALCTPLFAGPRPRPDRTSPPHVPTHREAPDERTIPPSEMPPRERVTGPPGVSVVGSFVSVQVNTDANGLDIAGDAANEPSIAVDPTNPLKMAIGWRQFDTIFSNFRQAGWGHTQDGGQTWTFPGVIEPGLFRSDPVLDTDAEGNFYYNSLALFDGLIITDVFKSTDGGVTWGNKAFAFGGDKAWMTIDRTGGAGHGHIYQAWSVSFTCCEGRSFNRSTTGGMLFEDPIPIPQFPFWGTLSVDPDGVLYVCGIGETGLIVTRSSNAQDGDGAIVFEHTTNVNIGGFPGFSGPPNPGGLLGQVWIATDHSPSPTRGNVYMLASVNPPGPDPLDVMFTRSSDGGVTWSDPVRVNDDAVGNGAWQWFGTMSVAPNGRIDAVWNDTRHSGDAVISELFHASSVDAGQTWSPNVAVSEPFNSVIGHPNQNKIGDYYDMVSDNAGADVAYSATFTGGQDVYYLRIGEFDCNGNGIADGEDIAGGTSSDCNENQMPDECEPDCNVNGVADGCDLADGTSADCDENRVPDDCEADFDGDGEIDACDDDSDGDGVPNEFDACPETPDVPVNADGGPLGDTDGDCVLDLLDLARLLGCLTGDSEGALPADACAAAFDYNADARIDLADVAVFQNVFASR